MITKLKNLFKRAKTYYKDIAPNAKEFSLSFALADYFDKLLPPVKKRFYINALTRYMRREMRPITEVYRRGETLSSPAPLRGLGGKTPVWVCWWQGEEAMPPVVRACFNRLKRMLPEDRAELHLITEENVKSYIDLPENIVDGYKTGVIAPAHYTDYLRYELVRAYGGIWLDATVYLSGGIDERMFDSEYFTQKFASWKSCPREACRGKWNNFYFSAKKDSVLCSYVCDALRYWHGRHKTVPDYVFLDYIFMAAYIDVPEIRGLIDRVPPNCENIWQLMPRANDPYDEASYRTLLASSNAFKLTYKHELVPVLEDGKETLYGHILKENGVCPDMLS